MNFFILGSQRCGTTWIHELLVRLGVNLPINKQTYYFDRHPNNELGWYYSNFSKHGADIDDLKGEVATGYCLPDAFRLLNQTFPKGKLILVVRHPIDRSYSNYSKRFSDYPNKSFSEALNTDSDLLERSLYGEMIDNISQLGRSEDLLVLFYEDLQEDAFTFAKKITNHIGIHVNELELKKLLPGIVNSSRYTRISAFFKHLKLGWMIECMKAIGVKKFLDLFVPSKKTTSYHDSTLDELDFSVSDRLKNNDLLLFKYTKRKYFEGIKLK